MANYHLHAKPIQRSAGRSATAAAAYRAGEKITDLRTGEIHDFTRKKGVLESKLILPGGGTENRADFWNRIEHHHKRGDAVLSREIEISLPAELTSDQRKQLAFTFASDLSNRYGVAADISLHEPDVVTDRDLQRKPDQHWEIDPDSGKRTNGNYHAHIMLSACAVSKTGELGKKVEVLDPIHCKRAKIRNAVDAERESWADMQNFALRHYGHDARVDHRTLEEQGIMREPQVHLGPAAHGFEKRTGTYSERRKRAEEAQEAEKRLTRARDDAQLARRQEAVERSIIDLTTKLEDALAQRAAEEKEKEEMPYFEEEPPPDAIINLWPDRSKEPSPLVRLERQYAQEHAQREEARGRRKPRPADSNRPVPEQQQEESAPAPQPRNDRGDR